jgi:hypothetical protein
MMIWDAYDFDPQPLRETLQDLIHLITPAAMATALMTVADLAVSGVTIADACEVECDGVGWSWRYPGVPFGGYSDVDEIYINSEGLVELSTWSDGVLDRR